MQVLPCPNAVGYATGLRSVRRGYERRGTHSILARDCRTGRRRALLIGSHIHVRIFAPWFRRALPVRAGFYDFDLRWRSQSVEKQKNPSIQIARRNRLPSVIISLPFWTRCARVVTNRLLAFRVRESIARRLNYRPKLTYGQSSGESEFWRGGSIGDSRFFTPSRQYGTSCACLSNFPTPFSFFTARHLR